ncbi:MAG: PG0541 family transporter-associated protein [Kiritimatiellia bacterium]|jgi:hypothetical protein
MKELTVVFNVSISGEVEELLRAQGIGEYTLFPRCHGTGKGTGPRKDDHVWPGFNVAVVAVTEDARARRAMDALQRFREGVAGRQAGIFAYTKPVDAVLEPPRG